MDLKSIFYKNNAKPLFIHKSCTIQPQISDKHPPVPTKIVGAFLVFNRLNRLV